MNLRLTLTIAVCKVLIKACRLINQGGTTLPGKIALRLYPGIISKITQGYKTIMITGTNGKTTTARIIGQILKENGIDFISNKSGANLVYGVISTFIEAADLKGGNSITTALIEIDEAAFSSLTKFMEPHMLVVTNFFRDQLDRYGELYATLKGVLSGIERCEKTKLVLNADDSLCASLGRNENRPTLYYGFSRSAYSGKKELINSDALFCVYCKGKYEYSYRIYGHLGGFSCPRCGYGRPQTHITCTHILELNSTYSLIRFSADAGDKSGNPQEYEAKINLPGLYNIYNALAAAACGSMLGLPVENTIKALKSFECGFGRMETIVAEGKLIKVILVKNPTGFNQVLSYLLTEEKNMQLAFLINDNAADGTDISWLWDVEFEKLEDMQDKLDNIYASGLRAEDMAVRLKYAGVYTDKIHILKDYNQLINTGLSRTKPGHSFFILPTYTAMLDIRKILKKKFGLKEFWK
ncbi:MAG: Mur ligase family protein [Clostridiales bacterium]|jgi:UDP-N-acetylmuramyl tripeptide synthase|nr:Mur ligase family protein [Eubacteriales bacterium]MDH7564977.1 Mur ligase family protein [Clostridiales bacterium]